MKKFSYLIIPTVLLLLFIFLPKCIDRSDDEDFNTLIENGAIIIDVRTKSEYNNGHIKDSYNIPLSSISSSKILSLGNVDKNTTIITCCKSGGRSSKAKEKLKDLGFENVYNGGGWKKLEGKIK
tara:strand:- start:130 stop:501 length:372 start_codon:yes stop_codon:yes gene_type:complete